MVQKRIDALLLMMCYIYCFLDPIQINAVETTFFAKENISLTSCWEPQTMFIDQELNSCFNNTNYSFASF